MDTIGQPLTECIKALDLLQMPYTVEITRPTHNANRLSSDELYVVRQRVVAGVYQLIAAAKMS